MQWGSHLTRQTHIEVITTERMANYLPGRPILCCKITSILISTFSKGKEGRVTIGTIEKRLGHSLFHTYILTLAAFLHTQTHTNGKIFLNWIRSLRIPKASCVSIDWATCTNLESHWERLSSHLWLNFVHLRSPDWILLIKMLSSLSCAISLKAPVHVSCV